MSEVCPFCKTTISSGLNNCPQCGSLLRKESYTAKCIGNGTILSGRYKIIRELGKGGMGTVYLAEETTLATGRYVAIKLLPAQLTTDPAILSRFQEEIKTAARLDHNNIVPIYFVGEHEGFYFFVMKYLEGGTIYELLAERGTFLENETRRIIAQVAEALDYAHSQGIIHRDIKASNIMISPDGFPTLMDFGVSRSTESTEELTLPGQIVGTAEYMSPEQWYGEAEFRSDIYSLGVVMYYMLTGKLPFKSKNAFELMKMHQESDPVPVTALAPSVSIEMEEIINWCMTKAKDERPKTGAILAAALRGQQQPPEHFRLVKERRANAGSTVNYDLDIPDPNQQAKHLSAEEEKVYKLLQQADEAYASGNLPKAVRLAKRAETIGFQSTKIDYRVKKYEHLQKTVEEIKDRAERKLEAGFVHHAIRDYQTVLQVYEIPEFKKRLQNLMSLARHVDEKFAEGKKLQLLGRKKAAQKCYEEVLKYDVENANAMERKHALAREPKRSFGSGIEAARLRKRILSGAVLLLVFLPLLIGIFKFETLLYAGADYFKEKSMYAQPTFFNAYNCYKTLDLITGPDKERDKQIEEMVQDLINKGTEAYKANDLKLANRYYKEAMLMMPPFSKELEDLENLTLGIEAKLKFQ